MSQPLTDREIMQQALEALEKHAMQRTYAGGVYIANVAIALRDRLAQPEQEFTPHEEGDDGWSDWVCPDPKSYLMKCCDCGLVHEAQFGVVRYKSESEREDCEPVDDPNLQAVFRMRRSEQWTPKDTAYRPGGLAQPEREPVPPPWWPRLGMGRRMRDDIIEALKMAQDALQMATLPFPIDPVKTQRALEAVDKVLDEIKPDGMLFDDWPGGWK